MPWILVMLFLLISSIRTGKKSKDMTVSVIIPAYNESKTVRHVVDVVKSLDYILETIVVDDGSTDRTAEVAEEAGAKVIRNQKNREKNAAIKTGFKKYNGEVAV